MKKELTHFFTHSVNPFFSLLSRHRQCERVSRMKLDLHRVFLSPSLQRHTELVLSFFQGPLERPSVRRKVDRGLTGATVDYNPVAIQAQIGSSWYFIRDLSL